MKDERVSVRISPQLRAEITEAMEITGLDEPTIVRECLKAFVAEIKAKGEIRLPLAIVPKSSVQNAENSAPKPAALPTGGQSCQGVSQDVTSARSPLTASAPTYPDAHDLPHRARLHLNDEPEKSTTKPTRRPRRLPSS